MNNTDPDCAGGMPCTDCPNKRKCQAGCIRQEEALERPNQNEATQRHPLDVEALYELQKVMADFGGDWPDVPGEQEVVRRAKMLSRLWKADRAAVEASARKLAEQPGHLLIAAERWAQLEHMWSRNATPETIASYIGRPEILDRISKIRREHEAAVQGNAA